MEDKMDTEHDLRFALERLCLEYEGLWHIARHYLQNQNPKALLIAYCSQPANQSQVSRLFDEVSELPLLTRLAPGLAQTLIEICVRGAL